MILLTIIVATGIILTLPGLVFLSLDRNGTTRIARYDLTEMTIITAIGVLAIWMCLTQTNMGFIDRSMMILLGGLLALATWLDRTSATAPHIIMLPFCILLFLLAPEVETLQEAAAATGFGIGLFLCGLLLWIPQNAIKTRIASPTDIIAIATPFILFRISTETAVILAIASLFMLASFKSRHIAAMFTRSGIDNHDKNRQPTILNFIFPLTLIMIVGLKIEHLIPFSIINELSSLFQFK